jgi:glycosyltransferase involved in cell wall biosynthesis
MPQMNIPRLAVVVSHPIQYYAPVFSLLNSRGSVELHVFYTSGMQQYDAGFGQEVNWDVPLLQGYAYTFLENVAKNPGSHHYNGIDNPGLLQAILAFNPDAVLVYGWAYRSHLQLLRALKGNIPVWFRGDSTLLDAAPWWRRSLRSLFLTWVYRHVDKVFYTGTANKKYFLRFGVHPENLVFAPHAIDNARFSEDRREEAARLRERLGITGTDILMLFAGKFEAKKSPLALIAAFKKIARPGIHLLLTGAGELAGGILEQAAGESNIHIHPFANQSQMPVYYQACDLFCLPSAGPRETWGLAVNEAMAAGRAVLVSSKAGCAADLVEEGVNGSIVDPTQPGDLIRGLRSLLTDRTSLLSMGKNGKAILKKFTFMEQVAALESHIGL